MIKRIERTNALSAEERERVALTRGDYIAAGVEYPRWADEPIPTLELWRRWQNAQNRALAYKRASSRADD